MTSLNLDYPGGPAQATLDYVLAWDAEVDRIRTLYIPRGDIIPHEYELTGRQANDFKAQGYAGTPPKTIQADMDAKNIGEAAATDAILATKAFYERILEDTRYMRKKWKQVILDASTVREKHDAWQAGKAELAAYIALPQNLPPPIP